MIEYVALNGIEQELWEVDYENKVTQYCILESVTRE
jgi:hypothetical protein